MTKSYFCNTGQWKYLSKKMSECGGLGHGVGLGLSIRICKPEIIVLVFVFIVMYLICICSNIPHRSLSMDLEGKVMGRARSKWDN